MSCKINFDEDRFFKIFGGDTPENRRWLQKQLGTSDGNLSRRLIHTIMELDSLYQNTYNEAYAQGQEDTRREVAEILGLL